MEILRSGSLTTWALVAFVSGCVIDTPQEEDPRVQTGGGGDEFHRPGQPCLLCHGPGHFLRAPGEEVFEVAGTIYPFIDSDHDEGMAGVEVTIIDAGGREYTVLSNRAGNFMLKLDTGLGTPKPGTKGRLRIPQAIEFPFSVSIRHEGELQEMKTKVWRNGSCSHCHGPAANATSVGRVFMEESGAMP